MAVLKVTRQPSFALTVVQSDALAVTFAVLGRWRLAVVEPVAVGGQPTMRRWAGVPFMGGQPMGRRSW